MKKINTIKLRWKSLLILFSLIIASSFWRCSKENSSDKLTAAYIVNINQAMKIANQSFNTNGSLLKSSHIKKIKSQKTFLDKNNLPYLHVINMEDETGKAFIIVSGDERTRPILAYSDNNRFPLDTLMPAGVADWLEKQMNAIESLRNNNAVQNVGVKNLWSNVSLPENDITSKQLKNAPIDDPNDCTGSYSVSKGPLLSTTWDQLCVYNELCPSVCTSYCGHVQAGCVATAMAQVLKYWQYSSAYDWASMQNIYYPNDFGKTGALEVARLMRDAGGSVHMNYGCDDGSGASMSSVSSAFHNSFGYSSGGVKDAFINRIDNIKSNLLNNQPVIFSGCRERIFGISYKCHAWVCDGFMESYDCVSGYGWLSFSMNWGWNGSFNGFYGISSWTPGDRNYQYDQDVIVNIHP